MKSNPNLENLIEELKKKAYEANAPIWKAVGRKLEGPTRRRPVVNIARINKYAPEGSTVVVPGKVLGIGNLDHKVNVAAWSFSENAKRKIQEAGGRTLTIKEIMAENPSGKDLILMG